MRGRNPIGFRPRFLWSGVGVPDFIIFDIVLNRLRLGKLGTSARFLSAFTIFAEDRRRFGNLCVQARTIALTFHYLCPGGVSVRIVYPGSSDWFKKIVTMYRIIVSLLFVFGLYGGVSAQSLDSF